LDSLDAVTAEMMRILGLNEASQEIDNEVREGRERK
jgi:hypothetical protein